MRMVERTWVRAGSGRRRAGWGATLVLLLCWSGAHAGQPLETETARLPSRGQLNLEGVVEFQTSSEGTETAVPLAFEYGVTDWLEVLVEPVLLTDIRPKSGHGATGLGDLELTVAGLLVRERRFLPAIAIAGEVKLPTAESTLITTGETDYSPFIIASKQFGRLDTHINFGYAILGSPPGVHLDNIYTYAAAAEYHLNERWDLVAEAVGNTSSSPRSTEPVPPPGETPDTGIGGATGAEAGVSAEAAGAEVAGLIGGRYYVKPNLFLSLGVIYDNRSAVVLRPGITYAFDLFQ